jgi:hypothetical protein
MSPVSVSHADIGPGVDPTFLPVLVANVGVCAVNPVFLATSIVRATRRTFQLITRGGMLALPHSFATLLNFCGDSLPHTSSLDAQATRCLINNQSASLRNSKLKHSGIQQDCSATVLIREKL